MKISEGELELRMSKRSGLGEGAGGGANLAQKGVHPHKVLKLPYL